MSVLRSPSIVMFVVGSRVVISSIMCCSPFMSSVSDILLGLLYIYIDDGVCGFAGVDLYYGGLDSWYSYVVYFCRLNVCLYVYGYVLFVCCCVSWDGVAGWVCVYIVF